jgi:prefoldin alpha subunit
MLESHADDKVYQDWIAQVQYLERLLEELDNNTKNIELLSSQIAQLETLSGNEEILAPVANGIFIKAQLKDSRILKVNVGKGIMLDRTIPETVNLIEKQEQEIHKTREQVLAKLEELYEMAKQY